MAPVGSWDSLTAAWQSGADAIYFGIENLNMRSKSSVNFTLDDLHTIATWCRERGIKTYLTVNTIIYDEDIDYMHSIVDAAREAQVTAIIASDMATILYARSIGVEVHISTQVNVSNSEAVRFYAQWADVMVMARELNLEQVYQIHEAIKRDDIRGPHGELVRIEMFCHGALCMAVSGKCYMSLHEAWSSANRGACRQICRRGYTVTDRETGYELTVQDKYIMSPKDLKTIHFLNKMVDAGVTVFKIEGRARGPEYVRMVVSCYNEALNAIINGTYDDALIARLTKEFNADKAGWCGGTPAQAAQIPDLTPAQVKAHMIEESGGNGPVSKAAWAADPLQVNVPGDWGEEKTKLGLSRPSKRNEGTAETNVRAAIKYLARKGFGVSGRPAAV